MCRRTKCTYAIRRRTESTNQTIRHIKQQQIQYNIWQCFQIILLLNKVEKNKYKIKLKTKNENENENKTIFIIATKGERTKKKKTI